MSTPDTAPTTAEVEAAVRALDRELRRLRIPRAGRTELVGEVRADLRAAAADGLTPDALLGDVEAFAREAAVERGHLLLPRDSWAGAAVALVAGAGALVVGYLLIELLHPVLTRWVQLDGHYPVAGPVLGVRGVGGARAGRRTRGLRPSSRRPAGGPHLGRPGRGPPADRCCSRRGGCGRLRSQSGLLDVGAADRRGDPARRHRVRGGSGAGPAVGPAISGSRYAGRPQCGVIERVSRRRPLCPVSSERSDAWMCRKGRCRSSSRCSGTALLAAW